MPSIWSKILMPEWSLPYNCYEIGHTWTPSCDEAALGLSTIVFIESLKLYTPLYIFSAIINNKFDRKVLISILKNILRSSSFLGFTAFLTMTLFCNLRKFSGKFYYSICAYLPMFVSGIFSILIEKKSRRGPLAIYCANIASETVYRMLVSRHYIKPIYRGEVVLFTATIPLLLYMIRKYGYGRDSISIAIKILLGREESDYKHNKLVNKMYTNIDENYNTLNMLSCAKNKHKWRPEWIFKYFISKIDCYFPRHSTCKHHNISCFVNTVKYFARNFLIGWLSQSLISIFSKPKLITSSQIIFRRLSDKRNIRFGLFLGSFTAIFKGINCLLRWTTNSSNYWQTLVAALFAGPTMLFSPNTTITLYLLWRCIEMIYLLAVSNGVIGCVHPTTVLLYAISTAQLAYVTILEPNAIRPSYLKFIDQITGQKLSSFNRSVLSVFTNGDLKGCESKFPDLNLKYTSRQFQENVLSWLI